MTQISGSILVVDDDKLSLDLLKRRLQTNEYEVTTVSTGRSALDLLNVESFDLVLLDIMLPDINGVKILEEIKNNPMISSTPVIMVTANGDREMVLKCIDSGATDYLVKPFSMSIVNSRIQRCLANSNLQQADINTGNNLTDARILLVDDQELNRDVLAHRLKKSGYIITSVNNGNKALELLNKEQFDLILLDIMMPDISGIDVLKEIRKSGAHKKTPVIMTTALDNINAINECMDAGADDYITKPLNTILLKLRISSCLLSKKQAI